MANKYDTMVSSIVDLVGGKENIRSFAHCVTRLRFNVRGWWMKPKSGNCRVR